MLACKRGKEEGVGRGVSARLLEEDHRVAHAIFVHAPKEDDKEKGGSLPKRAGPLGWAAWARRKRAEMGWGEMERWAGEERESPGGGVRVLF
jgi:hypothetical protein